VTDPRPPRILAVIPARGGSKGLPGKNIRQLFGLPLIVHSIRAAELTPSITRCVVSTDSEQIASVATSFGGEAPFLRPAELAGDDAPMAPVVRHALEWCEAAEGERYDAVLLLDPTSPARVPGQLDDAARRLTAHPELDGVISVSEPTFNPVWVGVRPAASPDGALQRFFEAGTGVTRRQDTDRFLRINGNFYLWRADFVRRLETSWFDEGRHAGAEIPESQAFSIDDEYEFRLIEALIVAGIIRLPWIERESP
jgi:CMP-N-acetylneuraminic acid synthetase